MVLRAQKWSYRKNKKCSELVRTCSFQKSIIKGNSGKFIWGFCPPSGPLCIGLQFTLGALWKTTFVWQAVTRFFGHIAADRQLPFKRWPFEHIGLGVGYFPATQSGADPGLNPDNLHFYLLRKRYFETVGRVTITGSTQFYLLEKTFLNWIRTKVLFVQN